MAPVFKPTADIITLCDMAEGCTKNFFKIRKELEYGTYEHEVASDLQLVLSTRLIQAITELGKKDLSYIPAALVIARAIFEGLVKTSWMLLPDDKFVSETGFIAYLATEIEYLGKIGKTFSETDLKKREILKSQEQVSNFKCQIEKLLVERGYEAAAKLPNVREMLKELNEERKYLYYIVLSQYTHFSHHSTSLYQSHLGTCKILEEKPRTDLWKFAFATTIPIFQLASRLFFLSLGITDEVSSKSEMMEFERLVMH